MRHRATPEQKRQLQQLSFNALIGGNQLAKQIGSFGLARLIPSSVHPKLLIIDEAWLFMAQREGRPEPRHHVVFAGSPPVFVDSPLAAADGGVLR